MTFQKELIVSIKRINNGFIMTWNNVINGNSQTEFFINEWELLDKLKNEFTLLQKS